MSQRVAADAPPGKAIIERDIAFTEGELTDNWNADRQVPSGGFTSVSAFDRDDVAQISIVAEEAHPTSDYHRTEGIKTPYGPPDNFDNGGNFGDYVEIDLYIDPDWEDKAVRAGLWVVGDNGAGGVDGNWGILEFANVEEHEGFRRWSSSEGWAIVANGTIPYGEWVTFRIELDVENGDYDYFIDSAPVGSSASAGNHFIRNVVLNSRNFGEDELDDLASEDYNVHWHGMNYTAAFDSIEDAVVAAQPGDTIEVVGPGTYPTGQVIIDKNLTITGTGAEKPTIVPDDVPSTGANASAALAWFLVESGNEVEFSGLIFDGDGHDIRTVIWSQGATTVIDEVDFRNIRVDTYWGIAAASFGGEVGGGVGAGTHDPGALTVTDSTFENIGRIGILVKGDAATATITGNTYTGKGDGVHLDYAVEFGSSAEGMIQDNTISDNRGVAGDASRSRSAGILVTTHYGLPANWSDATITGNEISDSTIAVAVGHQTDQNKVNITGNTFTVGNTIVVEDPFEVDELAINVQGDLHGDSEIANNTVSISESHDVDDAIFAAGEDGTVNLAAGTYEGPVEVSVDNLTIAGAGQGLTFIEGESSGSDSTLRVDNVTGFTVRDLTIRESRGHAIDVIGGSDILIERVAVRDFQGVGEPPAGGGDTWAEAIRIEDVDGITVHQVDLSENDGFLGVNCGTHPTDGDGSNCTITDSDLTATWSAINVAGESTTAEITGNYITGAGGRGIHVSDSWGDVGEVTAQSNAITGNTIGVNNTHTNMTVDATKNWWGGASGPTGGGNTTGTEGNVTFSPWLCLGTDAAPGQPGFQPASSLLCSDDAPPGADPEDFVEDGVVTGTLDDDEDTLTLPLSGNGGEMTAVYDGDGEIWVLLGEYTSNPENGADGFQLGDTFLDIFVAGSTDPDATLTLTVSCAVDGDVLRYWNGSAWAHARSHPGTENDVPVCTDGELEIIFGPESLPALNALTGTPIVTGAQTAIEVQFPAGPVDVGDTFDVDIVLKATGFQGADITLSYDQTQMIIDDVDDIVLWPTGGSVTLPDPPDPPEPGNVVSVIKTRDNDNGTARFAFSTIGASVSGDDLLLARITFEAVGGASAASITMTSAALSDADGFAITPIEFLDDGSIEISAQAQVSGVVTLQGRTNHEGATVGVYDELDDPALGSGVTGSTGAYAFEAAQGTVTRVATMPGYLRAVGEDIELSGGTVVFPSIQLLGGDANGDGEINILDLSLIAFHYGQSSGWTTAPGQAQPEQDQTPDINGDGSVNILDLSVTAANYGIGDPSDW